MLVYVPRERFDYDFVDAAGRLLARTFGGRVSAAYPEFGDAPLARVHFIIGFDAGERVVGDLERRPAWGWSTLPAPGWTSSTKRRSTASRARPDETAPSTEVWARPRSRAGYRALNGAADAIADVEVIERLCEAAIAARRVRACSGRRRRLAKERARFKLYAERTDPVLAEVVPILEHMGLKGLREDGFAFDPACRRCTRASTSHEYLVEDPATAGAIDIESIGRCFEDAMAAVWTGRTETDGFNRLVLELGVDWREAALIRAFAKYRQQSGLDPSQPVQEEALADNPEIARLILEMFRVRFDPANGKTKD